MNAATARDIHPEIPTDFVVSCGMRSKWSFIVLAVCCGWIQGACNDRVPVPETDDEIGTRPEDPSAMYSACDEPRDCMVLTYCVHPPDEPGYCSAECDPDAVDMTCEPSPGGNAEVACVGVGEPVAELCALDCSEGRSCPGGMRCEKVAVHEGQRELCF